MKHFIFHLYLFLFFFRAKHLMSIIIFFNLSPEILENIKKIYFKLLKGSINSSHYIIICEKG